MPAYLLITYTPDFDWDAPEHADELTDYQRFGAEHRDVVKQAGVLRPTATATTVRVTGARGGDVVLTDGPYAETTEVLTGYYLVEADDLDAATQIAADIPAAWNGAVEVRPVIVFG